MFFPPNRSKTVRKEGKKKCEKGMNIAVYNTE